MRRLAIAAVAAGALCLAAPGQADAQVHLGPQVSIGDEVGIGGRALFNLSDMEGWEVAATFDVFPDGDYWELGGNLHYNFAIEDAPGLYPYVGPGLNIGHRYDGPGDDTELGVNLVAGTKFQAAERFTPFAELRVTLEGIRDDAVVVTGGLLF